jgi:hypothetical protein
VDPVGAQRAVEALLQQMVDGGLVERAGVSVTGKVMYRSLTRETSDQR